MPFSFQIDACLDLLFIEAEGLLTPELLRDCVEEYVTHPRFRPDIDVLIAISDDAVVEIEGSEQLPLVLAKDNVLSDATHALASGRQATPHRVACAGGSPKVRTFAIAAVGLMDGQSENAAFEKQAKALEWLGRKKPVAQW